MATIIQSDKIATSHLGIASAFGLYVPAWLEGTYSAAYSVRRLRQAYTGPLFRLRNATNNAIADVACGSGRYSIDTTAVCTVTAAGTSGYSIGQVVTLATFAGAANVAVVRWYDQSGNGRWLGNNDTAAYQPLLMTAGAFNTSGGLPIVTFDGTDDQMSTLPSFTGNAAWIDAQPFSIVCATQAPSTGSYKYIWDRKTNGTTASAGGMLVNINNTANDYRTFLAPTQINDSYAGPNDGGKRRVYAARYNGASSRLYVDGIETASGNAGSNVPEDVRIGVTAYGGFMANKIHELLVLPSGTEDLAALSTKVMAYHGLA